MTLGTHDMRGAVGFYKKRTQRAISSMLKLMLQLPTTT
jgi:hypothetical protein